MPNRRSLPSTFLAPYWSTRNESWQMLAFEKVAVKLNWNMKTPISYRLFTLSGGGLDGVLGTPCPNNAFLLGRFNSGVLLAPTLSHHSDFLVTHAFLPIAGSLQPISGSCIKLTVSAIRTLTELALTHVSNITTAGAIVFLLQFLPHRSSYIWISMNNF